MNDQQCFSRMRIWEEKHENNNSHNNNHSWANAAIQTAILLREASGIIEVETTVMTQLTNNTLSAYANITNRNTPLQYMVRKYGKFHIS